MARLKENKVKSRSIQESEIERTTAINESNQLFEKDLEEKLQKAEMKKQITEEKVNQRDKDYLDQIEYVIKTIKIFDPSKNDEEITKCLEEIIKTYRKNNQELTNDDALSLTVEKLKQPNKKSRKKVNGNPQQVGNFIS